MRQRFTAGLLAVTVGAGLLAFGAPAAHAGSKGRRNTAIALGALAAYGLLKGKTTQGLVAGAGAAYAYKRYRDARKGERRSARYASPYGGYYRTNSAYGGYQVPVGYSQYGGQYGYGGQYQYGDQYQNGSRYRNGRSGYRTGTRRASRERRYTRGDTRPYVTDEWGNRRYYDPRQGDGFHRYDGRPYRRAGFRSRYDVETSASRYGQSGNVYCPPGQSRGRRHKGRR